VSQRPVTGRSLGLVACDACGRTARLSEEHCLRCSARLADRETRGTQAVWAFLIAGIVAYVPANLYPMLITEIFGRHEAKTIIGGAVELISHGGYLVGAVVLVASVVIPVLKFLAVGYLAISIDRGSGRRLHEKRHLHHLVELIGRWSMVDVFVVAVLAALVQLGFLARIEPGPAAAPFAVSVILTMLAAQALDTRAIWNPPRREIPDRD
jgi:paraquat-inducible protein A